MKLLLVREDEGLSQVVVIGMHKRERKIFFMVTKINSLIIVFAKG